MAKRTGLPYTINKHFTDQPEHPVTEHDPSMVGSVWGTFLPVESTVQEFAVVGQSVDLRQVQRAQKINELPVLRDDETDIFDHPVDQEKPPLVIVRQDAVDEFIRTPLGENFSYIERAIRRLIDEEMFSDYNFIANYVVASLIHKEINLKLRSPSYFRKFFAPLVVFTKMFTLNRPYRPMPESEIEQIEDPNQKARESFIASSGAVKSFLKILMDSSGNSRDLQTVIVDPRFYSSIISVDDSSNSLNIKYIAFPECDSEQKQQEFYDFVNKITNFLVDRFTIILCATVLDPSAKEFKSEIILNRDIYLPPNFNFPNDPKLLFKKRFSRDHTWDPIKTTMDDSVAVYIGSNPEFVNLHVKPVGDRESKAPDEEKSKQEDPKAPPVHKFQEKYQKISNIRSRMLMNRDAPVLPFVESLRKEKVLKSSSERDYTMDDLIRTTTRRLKKMMENYQKVEEDGSYLDAIPAIDEAFQTISKTFKQKYCKPREVSRPEVSDRVRNYAYVLFRYYQMLYEESVETTLKRTFGQFSQQIGTFVTTNEDGELVIIDSTEPDKKKGNRVTSTINPDTLVVKSVDEISIIYSKIERLKNAYSKRDERHKSIWVKNLFLSKNCQKDINFVTNINPVETLTFIKMYPFPVDTIQTMIVNFLESLFKLRPRTVHVPYANVDKELTHKGEEMSDLFVISLYKTHVPKQLYTQYIKRRGDEEQFYFVKNLANHIQSFKLPSDDDLLDEQGNPRTSFRPIELGDVRLFEIYDPLRYKYATNPAEYVRERIVGMFDHEKRKNIPEKFKKALLFVDVNRYIELYGDNSDVIFGVRERSITE